MPAALFGVQAQNTMYPCSQAFLASFPQKVERVCVWEWHKLQLFFFIFLPSLLLTGNKEGDICIHHLASLQHCCTGGWEIVLVNNS